MAIDPALFSSASDEWATPADLFAVLDQEFGFFLDVCATAANAKCGLYYSPANDGLAQTWPAHLEDLLALGQGYRKEEDHDNTN